jgi:hypothetical protein
VGSEAKNRLPVSGKLNFSLAEPGKPGNARRSLSKLGKVWNGKPAKEAC